MYTIISGTNRNGSHTEKVAREYQQILKTKDIEASLFSLKGLDVLKRNEAIEKAEAEILIPTEKFIFIIPEYFFPFFWIIINTFSFSNFPQSISRFYYIIYSWFFTCPFSKLSRKFLIHYLNKFL